MLQESDDDEMSGAELPASVADEEESDEDVEDEEDDDDEDDEEEEDNEEPGSDPEEDEIWKVCPWLSYLVGDILTLRL